MSRNTPNTTLGGFTCDHEACQKVAVYAPVLRVPYKGYPKEARNPMYCLCDVHVCPEHGQKLRVKELLTKEKQDAFEETAKQQDGSPAFGRTYLQFIRVNSPEFLAFQQNTGLVPPDDALVKGPSIII